MAHGVLHPVELGPWGSVEFLKPVNVRWAETSGWLMSDQALRRLPW